MSSKKKDDILYQSGSSNYDTIGDSSSTDLLSNSNRSLTGKSRGNLSLSSTTTSPGSAAVVRITNKRGKYLTYMFNFGLVVTMFMALIQMFDPTLDEHVKAIQPLSNRNSRNELIVPILVYNNNNNNNNTHDGNQFAVMRRHQTNNKKKNNNQHQHMQPKKQQRKKTFTINENYTGTQDRLLQLLNDAGINNLTSEQIQKLPKWDDITKLYGNDVIIYGKDKCTQYQSTIQHTDRIVGVAGLFNTGTNYLDKLLEYNLQGMEQEHLWQIPWGKHRMAYVKWNHTAPGLHQYNKTSVLPVVVIRDPYSWMQSMCKSPYATVWRHKKHHCPNLIPDPTIDTSDHFPHFNVVSKPTFDVSVVFDEKRDDLTTYHTSLAHLWSEWYNLYFTVDYPILIIRYEDLVFNPGQVLREIGDCVGGSILSQIKLLMSSSKSHGSHTDYTSAIRKTSDKYARKNNMTIADYDYAKIHLDTQLMSYFQYKHPSELSYDETIIEEH